ncbi:MAG: glycosyltransferase family 4 protein [Bdellovibrionota bacterium]
MRILVVHHRYRVRGGEDQAVDREVALLRGAGMEVELWERDSKEIVGLLAKATAAFEIPYSEQSRDELAVKLASYRPDVVHVHNWFPTFSPSIYDACVAAGVPVVQTMHNFRIFCASGVLARDGKPCELCLGGSTLPALRYACYQDSRVSTFALTRMINMHRERDTWNQKVNAFIALSHFSAGKLAEGGLKPEKIHVKPNFAFAPVLENPRRAEGYALFVGRLSKEKGVRALMEAWEGMTTPLWVVGDGPLRSELEALKRPNIRVLGAMPSASVIQIMSRAGFLVVPSECYENFPLVVAEAFSMGLPVVASRLGSLAEIVKPGVNGLLFEPGNAEQLRAEARKLAQDDPLRQSLSAGAQADYTKLYTPQVNLKMLLGIYSRVANAKAKT